MSVRFHRSLVFTGLSFLVTGVAWAVTQYADAIRPPAEYSRGFNAITSAQVKVWMEFLAGKETEGRGTGQPGYQKAADFMAARFQEYGLKPIGDDGTYFQNLAYTRSRIANDSKLELTGKKITVRPTDFSSSLLGNFEGTAELAVVRTQGRQPAMENADQFKDKFVIIYTENPRSRVVAQVGAAGAKGVFTVTDKVSNGWSVRRSNSNPESLTQPQRELNRITGTISKEAADKIVAEIGGMPDQPAENTATFKVTKEAVAMKVSSQTEQIKVPNVVGLLEGSDPSLAAEHVGIGAHLDHLGNQNGQIYYGADDDASGNAAMLSILKAFAENPKKPRRSILFMAFCGEEMGLVGSRYYADNPILPLSNMVTELQLDMVGRNEETSEEKASDNIDTIHLVGSKRISMELHNLIIELNKYVGFKFEYDQEDVYTRSDHYSFAAKGVPIAFMFSGFHPDYHQPTDTLDKINFDKIANAGRLFYLVANAVANQDKRLAHDAPPAN